MNSIVLAHTLSKIWPLLAEGQNPAGGSLEEGGKSPSWCSAK